MDEANDKFPPVTVLSKAQRRVLGVLVEKGLTVPDSYPMTLKALTTGCNQKNNREPLADYSEDDVTETLDQLRQMGLIGVVHTESGRTERYRHYLRHRIPLSEPQVAILTELLLRGRQQPGELRTRASRMVAIDNQEQLRTEIQGLIDRKLVQTNGPLDRRGVEVDHTLYKPNEGRTLAPLAAEPNETPRPTHVLAVASPVREHAPSATSGVVQPPAVVAGPSDPAKFAAIESSLALVKNQNSELRIELDEVRAELKRVVEQVEELRRALGG